MKHLNVNPTFFRRPDSGSLNKLHRFLIEGYTIYRLSHKIRCSASYIHRTHLYYTNHKNSCLEANTFASKSRHWKQTFITNLVHLSAICVKKLSAKRLYHFASHWKHEHLFDTLSIILKTELSAFFCEDYLCKNRLHHFTRHWKLTCFRYLGNHF